MYSTRVPVLVPEHVQSRLLSPCAHAGSVPLTWPSIPTVDLTRIKSAYAHECKPLSEPLGLLAIVRPVAVWRASIHRGSHPAFLLLLPPFPSTQRRKPMKPQEAYLIWQAPLSKSSYQLHPPLYPQLPVPPPQLHPRGRGRCLVPYRQLHMRLAAVRSCV